MFFHVIHVVEQNINNKTVFVRFTRTVEGVK